MPIQKTTVNTAAAMTEKMRKKEVNRKTKKWQEMHKLEEKKTQHLMKQMELIKKTADTEKLPLHVINGDFVANEEEPFLAFDDLECKNSSVGESGEQKASNVTAKPLSNFNEQYWMDYPTFFNKKEIASCPVDLSEVNERLLGYVNSVFADMEFQTSQNLPRSVFDKLRSTASHTNVCINPLQALRAWALLANLAQHKTETEIVNFVAKYTTGNIDHSTMRLNEELLALHVAAEEDFDGCVRLFTELPSHMAHNKNIRKLCHVYYGGKSRRGAIQHLSFATDPDGLYSCYRINQEMTLSTNGAVRYVVPETKAPNWRASIVLASAMDCTFFWKTLEPAKVTIMNFRSPHGPSSCNAFYVPTKVRRDPESPLMQLESHVAGVRLFIYLETDDSFDNPRRVSSTVIERIKTISSWPETTTNLLIPRATCSTPVSLHRQSAADGLGRVYCSEKSELLEMQPNTFQGHANFVTLFDHYHKTNFEILPTPPTQIGKVGKQEIEKSHQCVDARSTPLFYQYQKEEMDGSPLLTYYEDHLDQSTFCMFPFDKDAEYVKPVYSDDVVIDKPFYYAMTREVDSQPLIVCVGYFNNTMFVHKQD